MILYATFACESYRDWLDGGESSDPDIEMPEGCTNERVDELPELWMDLPTCPHCGGPSRLLELLEPVAG